MQERGIGGSLLTFSGMLEGVAKIAPEWPPYYRYIFIFLYTENYETIFFSMLTQFRIQSCKNIENFQYFFFFVPGWPSYYRHIFIIFYLIYYALIFYSTLTFWKIAFSKNIDSIAFFYNDKKLIIICVVYLDLPD